jgi:alanine racemase
MDVVRSCIGPAVKIMAVVKANAYGHGMRTIAYEAVRSGAAYLGVARVDEGLEIRKAGLGQPVLVFEVAPPTHLDRAIVDSLELTAASVEHAEGISSAAGRQQRKAKIHAKVDTGMGRLGIQYQQAVDAIEKIARLPGIELTGVYSHFATSDEIDQSFASDQLDRFSQVLEGLEHRRIAIPLRHMANSGAIISLPSSSFDMVRPGIMLYGYPPRNRMQVKHPLVPVLSLVSQVTFMKHVPKGTSISYGRRYIAPSDTSIATVPVGYGDGYSRLLTNNVEVLIRGRRYPAVGTICMDHFTVDVGNAAEIGVGDTVTLIGKDGNEDISAWELAEKLQTIPYEVTCMISSRVPRYYIE